MAKNNLHIEVQRKNGGRKKEKNISVVTACAEWDKSEAAYIRRWDINPNETKTYKFRRRAKDIRGIFKLIDRK